MPIMQPMAIQRFASGRLQQPDTALGRATAQLTDQRQGAAIRRTTRIAGDGQALRWEAGQLLEQSPTLLAVIQHARISNGFWQLWRPRLALVQLDADQHRALAAVQLRTGIRCMQLCRRRVSDAKVFAGRLKALTQQPVGR